MKSTTEIIANIENLSPEDNFIPTHIYIQKIIDQSPLEVKEVKLKLNLNTPIGYKYFDGSRTFPRDVLISILIVLKHDYIAINNSLKKNGFAKLYPKIERDFWIMKAVKLDFCIDKTNQLLKENGQKGLF